jgi:GNAT superfamily N-acetyltransferase
VELRRATPDDIPALDALIARSARGLCQDDYTPAQVEAAIGTTWAVDSELIRDGSYFAIEDGRAIVACGGWSRRRTLFGGDRQAGRESSLLEPAVDAARIRAFFVDPAWARRGLGRELLARCEAEARAHGFTAVELMATLPGARLYRAHGYQPGDRLIHPLGGGLTIELVAMRKALGGVVPSRS